MSEKQQKVRQVLNYFEHFLVFVSHASVCVSTSAFASLFDVPVGIASSALGLIICALTSGINKYKSIIKEKRKKYNKIVLLAKTVDFWLTSYELQVMSYELIFTEELGVTIYCRSYQFLFTYQSWVTIHCTSYEILCTYEFWVITYCTSYKLIFTYELGVTIYCTRNELRVTIYCTS